MSEILMRSRHCDALKGISQETCHRIVVTLRLRTMTGCVRQGVILPMLLKKKPRT